MDAKVKPPETGVIIHPREPRVRGEFLEIKQVIFPIFLFYP
jgi:hypothetical protein